MAVLRLTAFALALLALPMTGWADEQSEPELRAAMVYNLMRFVDWPADTPGADDSMQLCVLSGDADTVRAFAALGGRAVKGRTLAVQRRGPLADLTPCSAVYFDRIEPDLLADKLTGLAGRPVLTFATAASREAGTMIGLVREERRLAFDVRQPALRAAGLGLDARVLRLAREVLR